MLFLFLISGINSISQTIDINLQFFIAPLSHGIFNKCVANGAKCYDLVCEMEWMFRQRGLFYF